MMSVMMKTEIDRNPSSAPDLFFFGIQNPKAEEIRVPVELNNSLSLNLPVETQDLEEIGARVSPGGGGELGPYPSYPIDSPRASELVDGPLDMQGFEIGDLIWGKVPSHPWWPGHIYKESFASPRVRRTKRDGCLLVAFFFDSSYGWFEPSELVPLAPSFIEKSKQTTLRPFLKAVEESIDEASRRAALGLMCRCRNPRCFRPTRVPNYFQVDVIGYEPNGIYSKKQIKRAREDFDPEGALGFIKLLAVTQRGSEVKRLEWHQSVAVAQALRKARFEEFDEPYAQAFGQQAVLLDGDEPDMPQQVESFAPRVAPLGGSLKIAEDLGEKKKKKSKSKSKSKDKVKKEKHLTTKSDCERRADHSAAGSYPSLSGDYALQKREHISKDNAPAETLPSADSSVVADESKTKAESPPPPVPVPSDDESQQALPWPAAAASAGKKNIAKKMKKRNREEDAEQHQGDQAKKKQREAHKFHLRNVVWDLKALALNPFHGVDRNAPSIVRRIFRRFRRVAFLKDSALVPRQTDGDTRQVRAKGEEQQNRDKLVAARKKRPLDTERQDEFSAKRAKKLNQLKFEVSAKKKSSSSSSAKDAPKVDGAVKISKQEEPLMPLPTPPTPKPTPNMMKKKKESPTQLIMKFPQRCTLPSIPNLKARFARFGQLDVDSTRVFWRSHMCRVQFKYKADAQKAYQHVTNNDMFGLVHVEYSLRELAVEPPPPPHADPTAKAPSPARMTTTSETPGIGLKSILKKPSPEAGTVNRGRSHQRVKFMLTAAAATNGNTISSPPASTARSFADVSPPPSPKSASFSPVRSFPMSTSISLAPPVRSSEPVFVSTPRQEKTIKEQNQQLDVGRGRDEVDISHKMLSLLLRCSDIVARLSSQPGYVPFRPL